jgi:PadR family transcriptional regulator, regulatory protein PadR
VALNTLGNFEYAVLAATQHLGAKAYGLAIQREIKDRTGKDASIGAVYTTLERIEKKGYVTSKLGEATPQRGGRAKKYFMITGVGRSALNECERSMAAMQVVLTVRGIGA